MPEKKVFDENLRRQTLKQRIEDGSINNQKIWQFVKEFNSVDPGQLNKIAIVDSAREITYGQMFHEWEQYARVFSALGITEENHSRMAIVGTISAEPIFAYYAANMVGVAASMFSYPDLLPGGRWKSMVEKEHITDMIISDIMVTPKMWQELKKAQKEFDIKHIILLHSRMGGPSIGYGEMFYNEFNYNALKRDSDVLMMDSLIEKYKDVPIKYGKDGGDAIAVICHTSGTSNGTRKPLPYTDRIVNSMASGSPLGIPLAVSNGIMAGIENAAQSGETGVPPMGVMGAGMPNVGPAGFDPGELFKKDSEVNEFL